MRVLENQEAALVWGGVDKKAQDALYTIGYVIGIIARFIRRIMARPANTHRAKGLREPDGQGLWPHAIGDELRTRRKIQQGSR